MAGVANQASSQRLHRPTVQARNSVEKTFWAGGILAGGGSVSTTFLAVGFLSGGGLLTGSAQVVVP